MKKSNIYTATGDNGTTSLVGGKRVSKSDARLEAYGTVDELNAEIGVLIALATDFPDAINLLRTIQSKLFNIGAYLATDNPERNQTKVKGLNTTDIEIIEHEIDRIDSILPKLTNFVLPGGSIVAATAHVCRTITRRCERRIISLAEVTYIDPALIKYINRLSDYFFIFSRYSNIESKNVEFFWDKDC